MPLPFVVVEIAPPESPQELRETLISACTRAVQGAACVEASRGSDTPPAAVALVSWKDSANVRLEVAQGPHDRWLARDVVFDEHDPPAERWRTVGLLAGTLANVVLHPETPAPAVAPAPPVTPTNGTDVAGTPNSAFSPDGDERPRNVPPSTRHGIGFVTAAGVLGSALDHGPVRLGAELAFALRVQESGLHLAAGAAYSESAGSFANVKTTWFEAFVGLVYARSLGNAFVGSVHAEGLAERFAPSTNLVGTEGPTTGERWLGGARVGSDVTWWTASGVGIFAGGYGRLVAGTTEVTMGGEPIGLAPALGYGLRIGIAYGL